MYICELFFINSITKWRCDCIFGYKFILHLVFLTTTIIIIIIIINIMELQTTAILALHTYLEKY